MRVSPLRDFLHFSTPSFSRNILQYHFVLRAALAQLDDALRYKPQVRGLDFQWCHWNFY
jgi:hypothetical protein